MKKTQIKKFKKGVLNFHAMFLEERDGGYSVIVPTLPGCVSQGDTFEEAAANIQEAIELYLEDEEGREYLRHRAKKEFVVPVEVNA